MIKVKKLAINKFRSFEPGSEIEIGDKLTLIAGINGTAKSTLLGMIAQPLGFPSKDKAPSAYIRAYDDIALHECLTLAGTPFKAEYSDVFRMSSKFDNRREHEYTVYLEGDSLVKDSTADKNGLQVRSESRTDQKTNKLRFVTNSFTRKKGEGNFPHPVIYLGLDRLRPLSTLKKDGIVSPPRLSDEERAIWRDFYRVVMIVSGNEITEPENIETGEDFKKNYVSVETRTFDAESASAGQDNLGQIITAIISFFRLKNELKEAYQGGLLLIDEFDATLHPIAQELLLKKLLEYAQCLNLQIVSTTHSLTVLQKALHEMKNDISLLYLEKKGQKIHPKSNADWDFVQSDLAHIVKKAKLEVFPKKTFLFEDHIAAEFFDQVTARIFSPFVKKYNTAKNNSETSLSNDLLSTIADRLSAKNIPEFKEVVYT